MRKRLLVPFIIILSLLVGSLSVFADEETELRVDPASSHFSLLLSNGHEVSFMSSEDDSTWVGGGFRTDTDFDDYDIVIPGMSFDCMMKLNSIVYLSEKVSPGEVLKIKSTDDSAELFTKYYLSDGETKQFEEPDDDGYYSIPMPEEYFAIGVKYVPDLDDMAANYDFKVIVEYKDASAAIVDDIDALPESITLQDAEKVKAIRDAYDYLDDADKEKVTNYEKLLAAEETIANLEKIDEVEKAIASLPAVADLTVGDKAVIDAAKQKFEALPETLRTQVSNADKLALADAVVAKLIAEGELAKAKEDLAAAQQDANTKQTELDQAKQDVINATAALEEAQKKLDEANADKDVIKVLQQTVKKVKAKAGKKKTTVSWKSLGNGYQYEVYVSTKLSKGYKKSVTISKNKVVVKKIGKSKLKSKKTYYIKVRGFKTIDGKKVYTQFSEVVKVKIK